MFKKKPIYIILIVITSLLLAADLAFYTMTASLAKQINSFSSFSNMPSFSLEQDTESFETGEMPDSGNFPSMDDSNMPSQGSSDMPFQGSSDMPSQGSSDMPSQDSAFMPSQGSMPDTGSFQQANTGITRLISARKACIPAAVVLALLDAFSIFMLVRISHRKSKGSKKGKIPENGESRAIEGAGLTEEEAEAKAAEDAVERSVAKRTRRKKRNTILSVVLIAVLLIGIVASGIGKSTGSSSDIRKETIEAQAGKGTIDTLLMGAGTLEEEESTSVTIPGNVKVTSYTVANGDEVKEGDLIAEVDKTTVLSSIAELQTLMNELDSELESVKDETIEDTITASADGRVIEVFAEKGKAVADIMYEDSALILISLDGFMAVDFTTEDANLSAGDKVTIQTAEGDSYTGRVASFQLGEATVTLTDDGPLPDESVSVYDKDGNLLGDGTLYIHSLQKIIGFTGTISEIEVSAGDEVEAGDILLTLTDTDYDADYDTLLEERSTLESQMSVLMKAYMTGGIYASASGIISGLDTEDQKKDTSESSDAAGQNTITGRVSGGTAFSSYPSSQDTAISTGCLYTVSETAQASLSSGLQTMDCPEIAAEAGSGWIRISDVAAEEIEVPEETDAPVSEGDGEPVPDGSQMEETDGSESSDTEDPITTTESLAAWILSLDDKTLNSFLNTLDYDTLKVLYEAVRSFEETQQSEKGQETDERENTGDGEDRGDITNPAGDVTIPSGGTTTDPSGDSSSIGGYSNSDISSMIQNMTGQTTGGTDYTSILSASAAASLMNGTDASDDGEAENAEISVYTYSETEIGTLTPADTMSFEITVDEMDILSVLVNTKVQVTLDALPGTSFEGTITHVDTEGSNSGGDTKYQVTVGIERSSDMLVGMNANAVITLAVTEDILTIPEAALYEEGSHVYVYTSYDEKKDQLADPVEVTTGVSDGTNVQILSGLSEGDTFYYQYAETITYHFLSD